jgi:hypothetical protein
MVGLRHPLFLALWGLAAGCATAAATTSGDGARRSYTAADYYPLAVGWKWGYDVEHEGQSILATYAVLERIGDTAVVQAGDDRLTYAVTPQGIAQRDGGEIGDYFIKDPVAVGSGWAVASGTAKVVSTSQEVTMPAGHFTNCLVVEVTRTDPMRIVRTTYAPEVGFVAMELQVQQGDRFVTTTRATLRSVTRPGEDPFGK